MNVTVDELDCCFKKMRCHIKGKGQTLEKKDKKGKPGIMDHGRRVCFSCEMTALYHLKIVYCVSVVLLRSATRFRTLIKI